MNSKPVIDTVKKIPWDKVMKKTQELSKTLAAIGTTITIWLKLTDNTKKRGK